MIYARSSLTARPVAAPRSSVRVAPVRPSVLVRANPGDELQQGARDAQKNVSDHPLLKPVCALAAHWQEQQ